MNLTEANGIERYPFGPEGIISLKAEARRSVNDEPHITVDTNIGFELFVLYGEKEKKITVLMVNTLIKKIIYEKEYVTTSFPEDGRISFGCYVRPSIFVVCRFQGIRNEIRFLASFNRQKAFCIKSCRGNH